MVSVSKDKYCRINLRGKNSYMAKQEEETNIFASLLSSDLTYKFDEFATYYAENYKTPREEFEEFLQEQGIIGKIIDKIKNKFEFLNLIGIKGSYGIELVLYKYENEYILEYEAQEEIRKYIKNQKFLTEFILNILMFISLILVYTLFKICEMDTGISLSMSLAFAGFLKLGGKKLEFLTSEISKTKSEIKEKDNVNKKITSPYIYNTDNVTYLCYTS